MPNLNNITPQTRFKSGNSFNCGATYKMVLCTMYHLEQVSEVRAAGWQHHFVSFDSSSLTRQCHVNKVFMISELLKWRGNVTVEVVPAQAEVLVTASTTTHTAPYTATQQETIT